MGTSQAPLDMPLIVEATNEFYRQVYADATLGPIFKGLNMIVLRRHISYFVYELTHCNTPLTDLDIDHLRKVHTPVIAERHVNQHHFDILMSMLIASLKEHGAQGQQLLLVQKKLRPLREIFPPQPCSHADGVCLLQEQQHHGSSRSSSEFGSSHLHDQSQQRHRHRRHLQQQQQQQHTDQQQQQEGHQPAQQGWPFQHPQTEEQQKQHVHIKAQRSDQVHSMQVVPACSDAAVCSCAKLQLPRWEVPAATAVGGCSCKDVCANDHKQQQQHHQGVCAYSPTRATVGCFGCLRKQQQQAHDGHGQRKMKLWWQRPST